LPSDSGRVRISQVGVEQLTFFLENFVDSFQVLQWPEFVCDYVTRADLSVSGLTNGLTSAFFIGHVETGGHLLIC
jgi:hypothetical protein